MAANAGSTNKRSNNNDVLLSMCRTGKYVPSGSWVFPYSGQGMDKQRANSAWLMMTFPAEVRMQDVDNVFFGGITNQCYFEVDAKDEPVLLQVHDGTLLQSHCLQSTRFNNLLWMLCRCCQKCLLDHLQKKWFHCAK